MKGKTNEDDAVQVRREGRQGKNSGNKAELINQIQHRFGGKIMLARSTRKQEGRQNTGKGQTTAQNQKTHTHNEKIKSHDYDTYDTNLSERKTKLFN